MKTTAWLSFWQEVDHGQHWLLIILIFFVYFFSIIFLTKIIEKKYGLK